MGCRPDVEAEAAAKNADARNEPDEDAGMGAGIAVGAARRWRGLLGRGQLHRPRTGYLSNNTADKLVCHSEAAVRGRAG